MVGIINLIKPIELPQNMYQPVKQTMVHDRPKSFKEVLKDTDYFERIGIEETNKAHNDERKRLSLKYKY